MASDGSGGAAGSGMAAAPDADGAEDRAGGTGARLNPTIMARHRMYPLSARSDDPAAACRPFDADRDGMDDDMEEAIFGDLSQTGDGDPDHDNWPNLAEIQAGTDPLGADNHPARFEFYVGGQGANDANLGNSAYPLRSLHGAVPTRPEALGPDRRASPVARERVSPIIPPGRGTGSRR